MIYAHYDEVDTGANIRGFYDGNINTVIPEPNLQVTTEQRIDCLKNPGRRRIDPVTKELQVFTPVPESPASHATRRIADMKAACDVTLLEITSLYPSAERETWPKQEQEARAYAADPVTPVPFIQGLATARGITVDEQVSRIITKADAYAATAAAAIGKRQKLEDQIQSIVDDINLTDDEKRAAIDAVTW
ncbi:MAG: hypothetical protein HUJ30_08320 [Gammaproteobacteria bacterium]|nr:hypothetical protein [Gammaproteobacteria bacterium]